GESLKSHVGCMRQYIYYSHFHLTYAIVHLCRTLLENIFQRKLHDPRTCVTPGNLAELTATECRIGITKPETVRDIECLGPEFHLPAFGHLEFSRNCLRPVPESRGPQTADTHIPVGADWRERK